MQCSKCTADLLIGNQQILLQRNTFILICVNYYFRWRSCLHLQTVKSMAICFPAIYSPNNSVLHSPRFNISRVLCPFLAIPIGQWPFASICLEFIHPLKIYNEICEIFDQIAYGFGHRNYNCKHLFCICFHLNMDLVINYYVLNK